FQFSDQNVFANLANAQNPWINDDNEVFIGGNRNDSSFINSRSGDQGAFQLFADALGNRGNAGLPDADWSLATRPATGGYVAEYRVPLSMINTVNAPGFTQAGPGSLLRFNVGTNDSDANTYHTYGILWTDNTNTSPYGGGENTWVVDLFLDNGQNP